MRIKINFSKNTTPVSIANQSQVNGYIHKCLGDNNEYHDSVNNYSISSLMGGRLNEDKKTLSFMNGAYIVVSSNDQNFLGRLVDGLMNNIDFICGMRFTHIQYVDTEYLCNGWNNFATLSPFIIKEYDNNGRYRFLTLADVDFQGRVKLYLMNKIKKINPKLNLNNFDLIIPNHPSHKVKKILVKNVINYANQCHISIRCDKDVAELLYNIGIGQSTGSGFGTIYKTENHNYYRGGY